MSYRRLETLTDIARAGYGVELQCPCGHIVKHNPMVIIEKLALRGADIRLRNLGKNMKCGRCGGKDFRATHCQGPMIWMG